MKIVFHIGLSKTGSTLIQFFCLENRAKLLDNGILFPQTGLSISPDGRNLRSSGHLFFMTALRNNQTAIFDELHREIAEYKNVNTLLISSENFSFQPGLASSLKNSFKSYKDVKVIVYLRRQDLYLESLYSEFVCGGFRKLSVNPEEFTSDYLEKTSDVICDYNVLLESWAKAFGKSNIIVRPFEKEQWAEGDLLKDFFTTLNLPWNDTYKYPERKARNVSAPSQVNKTIRYLNRIPLKDSYYRLMLANFFDSELENYSQEPKHFLFSPSHRLNLLKHYDTSNVLVAKEYLGRENGVLFYQPNPNKDTPWQPVKINDPDLVTCIFALFLEQKALEIKEEFSNFRQNFETFRTNALNTLEGQGEAIKQQREAIKQQREAIKQQREAIKQQREAINQQSEAINQQSEAIKRQTKERLRLQKLLYSQTLATFRRSRSNYLKRLFRFLRAPLMNEAKLLHRSGLVDPYYYFKSYPSTIGAGITAAKHYVCYGAAHGLNPSENFNTLQYLAEHPDVAHDDLNPLVHFILNRSDKKSKRGKGKRTHG